MSIVEDGVRRRVGNTLRTMQIVLADCESRGVGEPVAQVQAGSWAAAIDIVRTEFADYLPEES